MSGKTMLKRILLLLGDTPSSLSARKYAFGLVQATHAEIAGLAGVDLAHIETPMPGAIGASAYEAALEEKLRKEADAIRKRLHAAYQRECEAHSVAFEWLTFDGDPIEALYLASETRDLVVTGHDTAFRGHVREPLSETLSRLLLHTPRPVIACGRNGTESPNVLIAYDGSVPAMRAIQLFVLLGLGAGRRVPVTTIDPDPALAARRADAAVSYLRGHGYDAEANPLVTDVPPADALRIAITERKIGTLVMGAYGRRGFRERLFGSTTTELVENPPCALFLYH
jgi:nucleotide-binding universal stress UspA family protein